MNPIIAAIETAVPQSETEEQLRNGIYQSENLSALVCAILHYLWHLGLQMLAAELFRRGTLKEEESYSCPVCGSSLHSKGLLKRQITTLFGVVHWKRRVLRCPRGCPDTQKVPSDEKLSIAPHEQTSWEVKRLGCLLVVFVPYQIAVELLGQLTGIVISESSLWNWVQQAGQKASAIWQERLKEMEAGKTVDLEAMEAEIQKLTTVLSADGVYVPLRPNPGSAAGKTSYQEVKVGIIARLKPIVTAAGKVYNRLCQRRVVALLGSMEAFKPLFQWEAQHQGVDRLSKAVWLSDGAKGLWKLYRECFSHLVGILDFYHASSHLHSAAKACFGDSETGQIYFERWRHLLRHGQQSQVLRELTLLVNTLELDEENLKILIKEQKYFEKHRQHVAYREFEQQNLPLGSGLVESACKWLIQQRFKGIGMRWSKEGFENLLYLRLAWVNQRFDTLFPVAPMYSPNL